MTTFHPFETLALHTGTIVQWDDAKGFGWVEGDGRRVFLHIREFGRAERRPRVGEAVRYLLGNDAQGRGCAKEVAFVKSGGRTSFGRVMLVACLLVLPVMAGLRLPAMVGLELLVPRWGVPGVMAMVSLITYAMYAHDKKQAVQGKWRVPEKSLHLLELLGGWPGALIAQQRLRHKSSKGSYQALFWCIVMFTQAAAANVISGHQLSRWVFDTLREL